MISNSKAVLLMDIRTVRISLEKRGSILNEYETLNKMH